MICLTFWISLMTAIKTDGKTDSSWGTVSLWVQRLEKSLKVLGFFQPGSPGLVLLLFLFLQMTVGLHCSLPLLLHDSLSGHGGLSCGTGSVAKQRVEKKLLWYFLDNGSREEESWLTCTQALRLLRHGDKSAELLPEIWLELSWVWQLKRVGPLLLHQKQHDLKTHHQH